MDEQKNLQLSLPQVLKELKNLLLEELGEQFEQLVLYGSYARHEAQDNSDVDVLIVLRQEFDYFDIQEQIETIVSDLSKQYEIEIAQILITKERFEHAQDGFLRNIRKDCVIV